MPKPLVAVALVLCMLPIRASAQGTPDGLRVRRAYVLVKLGAFVPQQDLKGFETTSSFEGTIGYRVAPYLAVEGTVGRFTTAGMQTMHGPPIPGGTYQVHTDWTLIPATIAAKAILPADRLEPFLEAGAGAYFVNGRPGAIATGDSATVLGFHAGAGVSALVSEQLVLGAEVRYVLGTARMWDQRLRFDGVLVGGHAGVRF